ncbi:hypothetical protein Droror1_Dr00000984 [Drosera rotundifolia]
MMTRLHHQTARVSEQFHEDDDWSSSSSSGSDDVERELQKSLVWLRDEGRRYELVATITHHGNDSSKGHYTADAGYPNGQWLRFDDASVYAVTTNRVLHEQAYVLFYEQVKYKNR